MRLAAFTAERPDVIVSPVNVSCLSYQIMKANDIRSEKHYTLRPVMTAMFPSDKTGAGVSSSALAVNKPLDFSAFLWLTL